MSKKEKLYWVDWYNSSGWCYRSTHSCPWEAVRRFKKTAKALGGHIEYSEMD